MKFKHSESWLHVSASGREVIVTCDYFDGGADVVRYMDADLYFAILAETEGDDE